MTDETRSGFPGIDIPVTRPPFPWVNVVLFLATACSTLVVGTFLMIGFRDAGLDVSPTTFRSIFENPALLVQGIPFSVALMSILLAHEMGHYWTCRHYGIAVTLPYFIPAPPPVGTFGAFIKIRAPFYNRSTLLEVGVAGPIAGFVVAVPTLVVALTMSRFVDSDATSGLISLGEPLIFTLVATALSMQAPAGMETFLHPVGFAAWVGFLVTALNLLPIGQLDGGHMAYALFPRLHSRLSQFLVFVLFPMGVFFWLGWLVWAFLLVLLGTRHPPTLDDSRPLELRQVVLAWIGLILLILCFMPTPVTIT